MIHTCYTHHLVEIILKRINNINKMDDICIFLINNKID
jgi:hypothetical protein